MKIKSKELKTENKNRYIDALYAALDFANARNEVKSFIHDLITESEQIMLGRRILIAKRLLEKWPHDKIVREMGVGLDTVFRVQKWLGGRHKGYEKIVEKIKKVVRPKSKRKSEFLDYYPTGGFAEIKRRYKSYYWLSNLLDEINQDDKDNDK